MSHGTDALYDFAAHDPRRSSPRAIPLERRALSQNILGNVALAFVATTCLCTVYAHVGANEEVATLAERFAAVPSEVTAAASRHMSVLRAAAMQRRLANHKDLAAGRTDYTGLLDGRHIGVTTGTLTRGRPSTLADHLVALATSGAPRIPDKAQDRLQAKAQDRFPMSEPRQTAQRAPVPAARPTKVASLQQSPDASAPIPFKPKAMVENKATVLALISSNKNSLFNKLFGKQKHEGPTLAYASADGGIASDAQTILFDGMPKYDQWTAVYDISARKVYMPDGTELEAHSGLGKHIDDPANVHRKMLGATPPHVYDLTMREALFHGVAALRLTPVGGEGRIFGRTGLLAHTYMLGPRGDSNGCVSFKDYDAFLEAYRKGLVKRMVVVPRLS